MKLKIAVVIALVVMAAFSMGCTQRSKVVPAPTSTTPTSQATQSPVKNPRTSNATSNVTQIEKTVNSTLENINQLLNQLNDIDNINFTI